MIASDWLRISLLAIFILHFSPISNGQDSGFYLAAQDIDKIKGVRIDDFLTFNHSQIPRLEMLLQEVHSSPKLFFRKQPEKILHLSFAELPLFNGKYVRLIFQALNLIKTTTSIGISKIETQQLVVEKFKLIYSPTGKKYLAQKMTFLDFSKMELRFKLGLVQRKLIIADLTSDFIMVFPVGVGGFDEQVIYHTTSLLTPRPPVAYLDRNLAISNRNDPKYFANEPFLRISNDINPRYGHMSVGFHIQQNKIFRRSFDSHGCVRLRRADLHNLYLLLQYAKRSAIELTIRYRIADPEDHPYPLMNDRYKTVAQYPIDAQGRKFRYTPACDDCTNELVAMEEKYGPPPVDILLDKYDQHQFFLSGE